METSETSQDFAERIAGLSPAKRALLERRLKASGQSPPSDDEIRPRARRSRAPLSFPQQRLWWLDQLEPGNSTYNVPRAIRMRGALNVDALEYALDTIVARHESLRTTFALDADGSPVQLIAASEPVAMPVVD
ncbi:MAG: condensation domain-containing protein, partial [Acidobacteria bacterium]|nr:condensation domain-containing protein [Acidobacteriota bacterium]